MTTDNFKKVYKKPQLSHTVSPSVFDPRVHAHAYSRGHGVDTRSLHEVQHNKPGVHEGGGIFSKESAIIDKVLHTARTGLSLAGEAGLSTGISLVNTAQKLLVPKIDHYADPDDIMTQPKKVRTAYYRQKSMVKAKERLMARLEASGVDIDKAGTSYTFKNDKVSYHAPVPAGNHTENIPSAHYTDHSDPGDSWDAQYPHAKVVGIQNHTFENPAGHAGHMQDMKEGGSFWGKVKTYGPAVALGVAGTALAIGYGAGQQADMTEALNVNPPSFMDAGNSLLDDFDDFGAGFGSTTETKKEAPKGGGFMKKAAVVGGIGMGTGVALSALGKWMSTGSQAVDSWNQLAENIPTEIYGGNMSKHPPLKRAGGDLFSWIGKVDQKMNHSVGSQVFDEGIKVVDQVNQARSIVANAPKVIEKLGQIKTYLGGSISQHEDKKHKSYALSDL